MRPVFSCSEEDSDDKTHGFLSSLFIPLFIFSLKKDKVAMRVCGISFTKYPYDF
jgi:hypothetical protein